MKTDIQKIIMDDVLGLTYPGNLPDYTINKAVRGMFLIISIDCIILTYHNLYGFAMNKIYSYIGFLDLI